MGEMFGIKLYSRKKRMLLEIKKQCLCFEA